MTEAELLQELAVAMRQANDDGMSIVELRAQTGRSSEYLRRLIRVGLDRGKLVRGVRYAEAINGRMMPISVFALKDKKAAKRVRARS